MHDSLPRQQLKHAFEYLIGYSEWFPSNYPQQVYQTFVQIAVFDLFVCKLCSTRVHYRSIVLHNFW